MQGNRRRAGPFGAGRPVRLLRARGETPRSRRTSAVATGRGRASFHAAKREHGLLARSAAGGNRSRPQSLCLQRNAKGPVDSRRFAASCLALPRGPAFDANLEAGSAAPPVVFGYGTFSAAVFAAPIGTSRISCSKRAGRHFGFVLSKKTFH